MNEGDKVIYNGSHGSDAYHYSDPTTGQPFEGTILSRMGGRLRVYWDLLMGQGLETDESEEDLWRLS